MGATATIIMETESLSDNQTKVHRSNASKLKYPVNILVPMMEKHDWYPYTMGNESQYHPPIK